MNPFTVEFQEAKDGLKENASFESSAASWDEFVAAQPLGQYQQSTAWAKTKAIDGWGASRMILRTEGRIVAGAQMLFKKTRVGKIGYLNKGPLVAEAFQTANHSVAAAVVELQKRLGLRAVIAQLPDRDQRGTERLRSVGYTSDSLLPIITATQVIDVSRPWETIEKEFRRSTRKKIRQARDRGVVITEGQAGDVPQFFELMKSTCQRQQTSPNPSTVQATAALWEAFSNPRRIRIHFAECEGRRIAAGLCILFGDRVTFWKKGWDQSNPLLQSNTILTCDAIEWACKNGYRWLDFSAVSPDIAEAMNSNKPLPEDVEERRDFFNLGFGGECWVMPPVMVRFRNPLAQRLFRLMQHPMLGTRARRALKGLGV